MADFMIGFDAKRIVRNGTGLGSYGRTLVNDLSASSGLQLRLYAPDEGRIDLRNQIVMRPNVSFSIAGKHGLSAAWWRMSSIVGDLLRDGVQLYHGLSGELPIGIRKSGIHSIVTIHDLIFMRHPEFYHWADVKIYSWKFRQTIREADHIIAISECTKRDIMELGGVEEQRISVIYQSCAPRFTPVVDASLKEEICQYYCLPDRFVLSVGSIEQRKNILLAVRALAYLPNDVNLVIVGRRTHYADSVADFARRQGLASRVLMFHDVPDQHLPAFYALAESFVYHSVYEGFGIPIIEAVNCGLPVVACTGSCLEEAGGPDCLYVAPDDEHAMATAISHTLRGADGRDVRIARSQQYVRRFSGADVAGQVVDLYRRILL